MPFNNPFAYGLPGILGMLSQFQGGGQAPQQLGNVGGFLSNLFGGGQFTPPAPTPPQQPTAFGGNFPSQPGFSFPGLGGLSALPRPTTFGANFPSFPGFPFPGFGGGAPTPQPQQPAQASPLGGGADIQPRAPIQQAPQAPMITPRAPIGLPGGVTQLPPTFFDQPIPSPVQPAATPLTNPRKGASMR